MALPRMPVLSKIALGFIAQVVTAQNANPLISNGLCYYSPGNSANSRYIPCGNEDVGHVSCCESGDKCMEQGTCFNVYTTYFAGCTDSSYSDPSCPGKGAYHGQEWVGLVYCNGTSDQWIACDESSLGSQTVLYGAPCSCPETSRTVALSAGSTLEDVAQLPGATGMSLTPLTGWTSATITAASSSILSSSGSSAGSTLSSSTLTSSSTSSTDTSSPANMSSAFLPSSTSSNSSSESVLSMGAKIGIGIAAAAGGIFGFALLWLLATCIRRRKKSRRLSEDAQIRPRSQAFTMEKDPLDELDPRSPAWSGNKSELPSEERNSVVSPVSSQQAWMRPTSAEVEGSIPTYQSMGSLRAQALGESGPVYRPYRKAQIPPIGVQGIPEADASTQTAYRPGIRAGTGVFEMPAQVPGSTLP